MTLVQDRAVPGGGRADRGSNRARSRDAHARRPRLRSRTAGSRARRARLDPPGGGGGVSPRRARRRRHDHRRLGVGPLHSHPRASSRALLLRRRRARRADRRLALRRRCGAPGPGGRGAHRRRGALPLAAAADAASGRRRRVPGSRRWLALRCRHERRSVLDDRRRAARQQGARVHRCDRLRERDGRSLDAAAAEHGADRGVESRGPGSGLRRRSRPSTNGTARCSMFARPRSMRRVTCRGRSTSRSAARRLRRRRRSSCARASGLRFTQRRGRTPSSRGSVCKRSHLQRGGRAGGAGCDGAPRADHGRRAGAPRRAGCRRAARRSGAGRA